MTDSSVLQPGRTCAHAAHTGLSQVSRKQQCLVIKGGWAAADTSDKAAYKAVNPARITYPPMLPPGTRVAHALAIPRCRRKSQA